MGTKQHNTMSSLTSYPRIGYPAPHFEGEAVVNGEFKQISLKDYKGKYLVLYFYPLDFTFVCPTEIVGVSVDSVYTHAAWINTPRKQGGLGGINYPLLADVNHEVSQTYGVLYKNSGHTLRGLFIIGDDEHQTLRQITMNEPPVGRNVDEVLRLVKAFQFNDKHGEVCPANWTPVADTIVPDVNKKLQYFEKH